jgi:phage terminase small subunit
MAGNQNSGRRPKPTALKVLHGNPGRRKLNEGEPKPPEGAVMAPERMSKAAKVVWDEIAPVCIAMGTLTTADVWAFKTLCELQATIDMASRQKDAPEFAPFTVSDDFNGAPKMGLHAAIKLEKEYAPVIRPYYDYFGLNPSGRAKVSVPKTNEPVSKWAGIV